MQSLAFTEMRTTTGFIGLGISPIAASGELRVSNASVALAARNAAAGADIALVSTTNADQVVVGDPVNAATIAIKALGDATVLRGAATKVTVGAAKITVTDGVIEVGPSASVAAAGALRVANATTALAALNQAGTADIEIAKTNNANKLTLGDQTNTATLDLRSAGDISLIRGAATKIVVANTLVTMSDGIIEMGAGGPRILKGSGSPEGVVTAPIGSMYQDSTTGGSGTTVYFKESGAGNTGWVAYSPGATDVATDANTLDCWNLTGAAGPFANTGSAAGTLAVSGASIRYEQVGGGPSVGISLFNATKTFLTGATGAANRPAGNNITLHGWFRFRNFANATQALVHRKYTASGGSWVAPFNIIGLWFVTGNTFEVQITTGANGAGARTVLTSDAIMGLGVDYHLAATFDGATLNAYCNGELVATLGLAANIDWNTAVEGPWVVGGIDSAAGDNRFLGVARRVRVESVAMTKAQIQNIYKHGIAST